MPQDAFGIGALVEGLQTNLARKDKQRQEQRNYVLQQADLEAQKARDQWQKQIAEDNAKTRALAESDAAQARKDRLALDKEKEERRKGDSKARTALQETIAKNKLYSAEQIKLAGIIKDTSSSWEEMVSRLQQIGIDAAQGLGGQASPQSPGELPATVAPSESSTGVVQHSMQALQGFGQQGAKIQQAIAAAQSSTANAELKKAQTDQLKELEAGKKTLQEIQVKLGNQKYDEMKESHDVRMKRLQLDNDLLLKRIDQAKASITHTEEETEVLRKRQKFLDEHPAEYFKRPPKEIGTDLDELRDDYTDSLSKLTSEREKMRKTQSSISDVEYFLTHPPSPGTKLANGLDARADWEGKRPAFKAKLQEYYDTAATQKEYYDSLIQTKEKAEERLRSANIKTSPTGADAGRAAGGVLGQGKVEGENIVVTFPKTTLPQPPPKGTKGEYAPKKNKPAPPPAKNSTAKKTITVNGQEITVKKR